MSALRLVTIVVDATVNGAVPVATVEVNPEAVRIPVEGTKDKEPEVVFSGRFPLFAVTHVG
jgi:hypothetical protein